MTKPKANKLLDYPEDLTSEECAKVLHKALAASEFGSIRQLAEAIGIPRQTLNHYFFARRKPPREKWSILRNALGDIGQFTTTTEEKKSKQSEDKGANLAAERLKAEFSRIKGDLVFFRDAGTDARQILKNVIPGKQAGYISGLLTALYDEDQLEAWITFSKDFQEKHK